MSSKKRKKQLLYISYAFPPFKSMASVRNFKFLNASKNLFDSIKVISTTNCFLLPKDNLSPHDFSVFFAPTLDYRTVFNSSKTSGVTTEINQGVSRFRNLKNSYPFFYFIGLGGLLYIVSAFIYAFFKLLFSRKDKTYIISNYKPYANHMIAYYLKRVFKNVHWIADFQNLQIDPDTARVTYPKLQERFNHRILKKADALITVSPGLVPHLKVYNPNIHVVELGVDDLSFNQEIRKRSKFTMSYTGSIYPEQKFDLLFSSIKELISSGKISFDQIELCYAGASSSIWNYYIKKYELEKINSELGIISYADASTLQKESHLNILLTWNTQNLKGIIPGKFYDYLSVNTPFFLLVSGDKDEIWEEKINSLKSPKLFYENGEKDQVGIKNYILQEYTAWLSGEETGTKIDKSIIEHEYLLDNIVPRFFQEEVF